MDRDMNYLYIKYEPGMDVGRVLRVIDGAIVNGRIRCDGVEVRDGEAYMVKRAGEYELVMPMPVGMEDMVYDTGEGRANAIEVRRTGHPGSD